MRLSRRARLALLPVFLLAIDVATAGRSTSSRPKSAASAADAGLDAPGAATVGAYADR